jgi:ribonuclease-3
LTLSRESEELSALERELGHRFREPELLSAALTHPSHSQERDGSRGNERLEFLGDAVLDLVVARLLYDAHPTWSEGDLSRTRAALVNTQSLARHGRALGLSHWVRLGRTERKTGGAQKDSILASVLEAVVGAMHLDGETAAIERLVRRLFETALDPATGPLAADPKTRLQEWAHATRGTTPCYRLMADSGVENDERRFAVEAWIGTRAWGRGWGRTKRAAERAAAEEALVRVHEGEGG